MDLLSNATECDIGSWYWFSDFLMGQHYHDAMSAAMNWKLTTAMIFNFEVART